MSLPTRRLIAIVGMHRSGTSCLAGSLQQRGLHLGSVFESSPYNPKGNRENSDIMTLNEAVLAESGGSWDRPPASAVWNGQQVLERDRIIEQLVGGDKQCGFKDPRTLLTLSFWRDAHLELRLIGSFRHPLAVARSLEARNGMTARQALDLWVIYNTRLLACHQASPFPLVSFDLPQASYVTAVDAAADVLQIKGTATNVSEEFFENRFRHHTEVTEESVPDDVRSVYASLVAASGL